MGLGKLFGLFASKSSTEQAITGLQSQVTGLVSGAGLFEGDVDTFADLPAAADHASRIWVVKHPTGDVGAVDRHESGMYLSDGTNWGYLDSSNIELAKFTVGGESLSTTNLTIEGVGLDVALDKPASKITLTSPLAAPSHIAFVAKSGNDSTGNGSLNKPYATIQKAIDSIDGSGWQVLIAPGTYAESPTCTKQNVTFSALGIEAGGLVNITGTFTFSHTASSVRVAGLSCANIAHTGAGNLYLKASSSRTSLASTSTGYLEVTDTDMQGSGTGVVSITGAGNKYFGAGNKVGFLTVNNASAVVTVDGQINAAPMTLTTGTLALAKGAVYAATGTTPAVTATGGVLMIDGATMLTPTGTQARISIGASVVYELRRCWYDKANSTLTGIPLASSASDSWAQEKAWDYVVASEAVLAANYPAGANAGKRALITNALPYKEAYSSGTDWIVKEKQDKLVSGTNLKTINGTSLLGTGDLVISGGGAGGLPVGSWMTVDSRVPQPSSGLLRQGSTFNTASYPVLKAALTATALNFTASSTGSSAGWDAVVFNGTIFCAVGYNSNKSAVSADNGATWTIGTLPATANWMGIAWNGSVFVAVASGQSFCAISTDGLNWTQKSMPVSAAWRGIAWNGTVFCAVAGSSTIAATSPDGNTWTQRTLPSSATWMRVGVGLNGLFVATTDSSNATARSSDNGVTWTAGTHTVAGGVTGIAWNGSLLCIVGTSSSSGSTSPDGITWTSRAMGNNSLYDVCWSGNMFIAVGFGVATGAYSPDGVTWTAVNLPSSDQWRCCAANTAIQKTVAIAMNGQNVAVGAVTYPATGTIPTRTESGNDRHYMVAG